MRAVERPSASQRFRRQPRHIDSSRTDAVEFRSRPNTDARGDARGNAVHLAPPCDDPMIGLAMK